MWVRMTVINDGGNIMSALRVICLFKPHGRSVLTIGKQSPREVRELAPGSSLP